MDKIKNENAITLVAIVVTIILILILAGVTINLTLNDNGILKVAQSSSNLYANTTKNENQILSNISEDIYLQTIEERTLINQFKKGVIKVGDYIDYKTPDTGEFITTAYGDENSNGFANQSFNVENNGRPINWRILGLGDKNGNLTMNEELGHHLLLISSEPVQKNINSESDVAYEKDPYLYMGKAEVYENGERILNNISKIYMNEIYASDARSINACDINSILGIEIDNDLVYEKDDENKTNLDLLRVLGQKLYYGENDYSAESYLKGKKALENGETNVVGTGYCYFITNNRNKTIGNTTIDDLLFKKIGYSDNNSMSYWLATKGTEVSKRAGFGLGDVSYDCVNVGGSKFKSNGSWLVEGFGIYPIVSLKPQLTSDDLHLTTSINSEWNFTNNLNYSGNLTNY